MRAHIAAASLAALVVSACGPGYIQGTRIEATPERQAVAEVVERYRQAVEQRDVEALQRLASSDYYENGSTTEDPGDDYDFNGLLKVLGDIKGHVKAVKYQIDITDIQILGDQASVDFDYRSQFLFASGEQDHWETATDRNRLSFKRENGAWRIVSGM